MLALEERFMIREMYRKGVSISEIARRTRRDRKTIRQVVNAPELAPAKPSRQVKACKIDPYAPYLEQRMAGGVPRRLLYDNLKSVVLWRDTEDVVHWNPRFLDFADVAGFAPQACKPYRPQTKGKVENGVKYVRGNFWPGLHFRDLDDLNNQALVWLNATANPRVHGTTGEVPFTRLQLEGLQPADKALTYDTSVLTSRRRSKECVISYEGNLYSVPAAYARKTLQVKITEAGELVICSEVGQELARHRVLLGRRERSVQAEHYRGLATPAPRVEKASASQQTERLADPSPFWDAPVVEVRPLAVYDQLLWEVSS